MLNRGNKNQLLKKATKLLLIKLVILVIVWQCAYIFILQPTRIPDKFLTDTITSGVTYCINFLFHLSPPATWIAVDASSAACVQQSGKSIFIIADICNGLDLLVIYLGFIILLPYPLKRKITFSVVGCVLIVLANVIRCTILYWIYKAYPAAFEVNHHYIFTILMYLLIFFGWVLFIKKDKKYEAG